MLEQRLQIVRRWLGPLLCLTFVLSFAVLHTSCDQCNKDVDPTCDTSCTTKGICLIEYTYDTNGNVTSRKRTCREYEGVKCGECSDVKKDSKDRVVSQKCSVCNICSNEFQCFENGDSENPDCKGSTPHCRRGQCAECAVDSDCPAERPVCTDDGCTCTKDTDCKDDLRPSCVADVDTDKPKLCGCSKNEQCTNKEYPSCKSDQTCGCAEDKDCPDANFPNCVEGKCSVCQCPSRQPKQPYCVKLSSGAVTCAECTGDKPCISDTNKYCNTSNYRCVSCLEDRNCTDPTKPSCDETDQTCTACQCSLKDKTKPRCLKNADNTITCVQCKEDSDCASPTPKCNTKTNTCEASCQNDGDCTSEKPYCDGGECVNCKDFNDCKDPQLPRCVQGVCSCLTDKDCPANLFPTCSSEKKKCVECVKNADCSPGFPVCSTDGICQLLPCDPGNGGKECGAVPNRPNCREIARRYVCVGCTKDSECTNGQTCDLSKFVCAN
ncbi:MAG: hypothetical protein EP343_11075 [Deltaproteobacteria bacterium]|nr:MAG: hypothetical protein EP343_11075 [Deltaproteobacteria bacterium]